MLRPRLILLLGLLLPGTLVAQSPRVYRDRIEPHWFHGNARFWYRNDQPGDAREFIEVDTATGRRAPAFDAARVASELKTLTGKEFEPGRLPVERLEFADDPVRVVLHGPDGSWRLDRETHRLTAVGEEDEAGESLPADLEIRPSRRTGPATGLRFRNTLDQPVDLFWLDPEGDRKAYGRIEAGGERSLNTYSGHVWLVTASGGRAVAVFEAVDRRSTAVIRDEVPTRRRRARGPAGGEGEAPRSVASPDGRWEAFVRDHNLWLRETAAPSNEFPIGIGGSPGNSFQRDASRARLVGMDYDRVDWPASLPEVSWSPDSSHLVALQTRPVPERRVHLVESAPRDQLQPRLLSYPYLKPGDEIPVATPRLFRVADRREVPIADDLFPNPWELDGFRWAADSSRFTFVYNARGHQVLRVLAVEVADGSVRAVVDERSDTFIHYSGKFLAEWLGDDELLWMSERDGWNHLWLYDVAHGTVKTQVTRGPWNVRRLVRVDRDTRQVWFDAVGIRADQDPYHVHRARVGLDGSGLVVLTGGDGTHTVQESPDRRFLIDTWSRVDQPPVHELRRAEDGRLVCRLEEADAGEVVAARGRLPERFHARGRDGSTEIWGIIHRPRDFDPSRRYPVVENIYAGPHDHHVPKAFRAVYRHQHEIADRGFIVVQIDGMGTAWRTKAFHDVAWRNLRDAGFPDRIAWMRAAAKSHPEMDLARVGIYGGSAGGQNAVAALLWHGDFYRAAVADCGCHDNRMDKIWWNEQWMGWPVGPEYAASSNVEHASRLQGRLLLVVGELDRNVDPASTLQLAGALTRAGRDYDLMVVPGAGHGACETPWASRRRADFLVRHLQP